MHVHAPQTLGAVARHCSGLVGLAGGCGSASRFFSAEVSAPFHLLLARRLLLVRYGKAVEASLLGGVTRSGGGGAWYPGAFASIFSGSVVSATATAVTRRDVDTSSSPTSVGVQVSSIWRDVMSVV